MTAPRDKHAPLDRQRWIEAANVDTVEIPAFAPVIVTGSVTDANSPGRTYLNVTLPTASSPDPVLMNSSMPISVGGFGAVTGDFPAFAKYDSGEGTPAVGELWGVGSGETAMQKPGGEVFEVLGSVDTTNTRARVDRRKRQSWERCDFTLDEELTASDQTKLATVTESWPKGREGETITVYNMPSSITSGGYHFTGEINSAGRAHYDVTNDRWPIVEIEGDAAPDYERGSICRYFDPGTTPKFVIVSIVGVVDAGACAGGECPAFWDNSFVLEQQAFDINCTWWSDPQTWTSCESASFGNRIAMGFGSQGGPFPPGSMYVLAGVAAFAIHAWWDSVTTPINGATMDVTLTNKDGPFNGACDASASTARVQTFFE